MWKNSIAILLVLIVPLCVIAQQSSEIQHKYLIEKIYTGIPNPINGEGNFVEYRTYDGNNPITLYIANYAYKNQDEVVSEFSIDIKTLSEGINILNLSGSTISLVILVEKGQPVSVFELYCKDNSGAMLEGEIDIEKMTAYSVIVNILGTSEKFEIWLSKSTNLVTKLQKEYRYYRIAGLEGQLLLASNTAGGESQFLVCDAMKKPLWGGDLPYADVVENDDGGDIIVDFEKVFGREKLVAISSLDQLLKFSKLTNISKKDLKKVIHWFDHTGGDEEKVKQWWKRVKSHYPLE